MIPLLIKRCLAHGVKILPVFLDRTIKQYEKNRMPDEILGKLNHDELNRYIKGLHYMTCESASDWTEGYSILKSLGFKETAEEVGHRRFLSLHWPTDEDIE